MIRRLIILLLIVVGFAHEEMGELEKEMLYKQNDKSPLLAGLCAFTPTMGHLYLGEWKRGIGIFSISIFPMLGVYAYEQATTGYDEIVYGIPVVPFYYFQLQDAIYLAYQHNADLYEEIYGREYIRPPKKSLIQKWIDKKEAKKTP